MKNKIMTLLLTMAFLIPFGCVANGETVIKSDFENDSTVIFESADNKRIVADGFLEIGSLTTIKNTEKLKNYKLSFDAKIKFGEADIKTPSIQIRKTDDSNMYNLYFNSLSKAISLERVVGGITTPLSSKNVDFIDEKIDKVSITLEDANIKVSYNGVEIINITDAFPIGSGGVAFKNGSGKFFIDNLEIEKLKGGIKTYVPNDTGEKKEPTEIVGDIIYENDFETGDMSGIKSFENKSKIIDDEGNKVYHVKSYDYDETTFEWINYSLEFDAKIDYREYGKTWPAIYIRRTPANLRYEIYFESGGEAIAMERVQGGEKKYIGGGTAKYLNNNDKWAHIKIDVVGNTTKFYYGNMDIPAFVAIDENSIPQGGIGFGDGGAKFYVDNIVVRKIMENKPILKPTEEQTDYDSSPFKNEINKLKTLGFVTAQDNKFRPTDDLTRGEFAVILSKFLNLEVGTSSFSDVPATHPYYEAISSVGAYMQGYDTKTFGPDDEITINQVSKILMSALGYDIVALNKGGYPTGYFLLATEKNLLKKVELGGDDPVSRENIAKIISNALDINLYVQTQFGEDIKFSEQKGKTILTEFHNIYKEKGLLSANYRGGIYGKVDLAKDEIVFNNKTYKSGLTDVGNSIGKYLTCYIKYNDDNGTVVYYEEDKTKFDIIDVKAQNILKSTTLSKFVYEVGNNIKTIDLSKNANIMINGGNVAYSDEMLMPKSGSVKLISTKNNKNYDLILVESYETVVANSVSYRDKIIYGKFYNERLELSNSESEITKNHIKVDINEIKAGDVLSIAKTPNSNYIKIMAADLNVSGLIAESKMENRKKVISINDNIYTISDFYDKIIKDKLISATAVGEDVTAFLDAFGEIAYVNSMKNDDYAMIYDIRYSELDGWKCTVLTKKNKILTLQMPENIKVDGKSLNLKFDQSTNVSNNILFENFDPIDKTTDTIKQIAKIQYTSSNKLNAIELPKKSKDIRNILFTGSSSSFNNISFVDGKTTLFVIPQDKNDITKYSVKNSSYLKDGKFYSATTYEENLYEVARIILLDESNADFKPGKLDRPFVFSTLTSGVDSDGEPVCNVKGYQSSDPQVFQSKEISTFQKLKAGDVVRITRDTYGNPVGYVMIYEADKGRVYSKNPSVSMAADLIRVSGDVISYDAVEGRVRLCLGKSGDNDIEKAYIIGGAYSVYVVSDGKVMIGDLSDIAPADFVLLEYSWYSLRDLIIYK